MKPKYAFVVFIAVVVTAICASVHSYKYTEDGLAADMNQALAKTLADKTDSWITPDTIADYRSNLKSAALKEHSYVYYAVDSHPKGLRSRRIKRQINGKTIVFQCYANCSLATIWSLSDQRLPLMLLSLSAVWVMTCLFFQRKKHDEMGGFCAFGYSEATHCFVNSRHEPIDLTPMQEQLVALFLNADGNYLLKEQICAALWPKKPDASDTLYTLVKHLRPILKAHTGMTIVSERGKGYRLVRS